MLKNHYLKQSIGSAVFLRCSISISSETVDLGEEDSSPQLKGEKPLLRVNKQHGLLLDLPNKAEVLEQVPLCSLCGCMSVRTRFPRILEGLTDVFLTYSWGSLRNQRKHKICHKSVCVIDIISISRKEDRILLYMKHDINCMRTSRKGY